MQKKKCCQHETCNDGNHMPPHPPIPPSKGNFVPLIQNKIDLASSTYVNNPIIPEQKPIDCILKNKKYQIIIGFKNDIQGEVWPSWMKEPIIHALEIDEKISSKISAELSLIKQDVSNLSSDLSALSSEFITFTNTPATISSLGVVKSSDKVNQISVLNDGTMEINAVGLGKLSQDMELRLNCGSILDEIPKSF